MNALRRTTTAACTLALGLALAGAGGAAAASAPATGDGIRTLPPSGTTIIVQPQAVAVLAGPVAPGSARVTVTDGCGTPLALGPLGTSDRGFSAPLPAQNAGPGSWHVEWAATTTAGTPVTGVLDFDVAQGVPCDGAAGAQDDPGTSAHHVGLEGASGVVQPVGLTGRPALQVSQPFAVAVGATVALLLAGLGALLLGVAARDGVRTRLAQVCVVVTAHAAVLALALPGRDHSWASRTAVGLAGALLVSGCVSVAMLASTRRPVRLAAVTAAAVVTSTALVATFLTGRAVLLDAPAGSMVESTAWAAAASGLVAVLLVVGGWYGRTGPEPSSPPAARPPVDRPGTEPVPEPVV